MAKRAVISDTRLISVVCFTAALLLLALPVFAQVDRATLTGHITDPSGSALVGAKITILHPETGFKREMVVGETGYFNFPQLPLGHYTVTIEATGFKGVKYDGVQLLVGQTRTIDAQLEVATLMTQIEVKDTIPPLDRSSAELGTVIQETQIGSLPVNGRHWAGLMLLAPGAVNTGSGSQDSTRFVGRANDDNNWTYDGIDNTAVKDPTYGSNVRLVVSMDSIAEFKVSSSLYSAESGSGMGGQVHLVSKTGSNEWHGGVFEYLRNSALDARTIFDGPTLPPFKLNQFGGNLGGPIAKGKLFFFINYEGLRQRQGSTYTEQVPSALLRNQVLTKSPALKKVIDAYPLGTRPTKDPLVDDVIQNFTIRNNEDAGTLRLDYNISDKTTLFGRWNINEAHGTSPGGLREQYYDGDDERIQNFVFQVQRTFSPTVVNETRFGINRVPRIEDDTGISVESFSIPGLTQLHDAHLNQEIGTTISVLDNFSIFRGRHNLKFGAELRRIRMNVGWNEAVGIDFASMTDFINNELDGISIDGGLPMMGARRTYYYAYAQDEFKLRPNFTISFGARYEYYSVLSEVNNRLVVFDETKGNFAPQGTPAYYPDRNNIAPRFAATWAPGVFKNKTVIRGGFGMFYGPGQVDDVFGPAESYEQSYSLDSGDVPGGISYPIDPYLGLLVNEGRTPRHLKWDRRDMYSNQWGLSIQQELPSAMVIQVGYNGNNAHHIMSRSYINNYFPYTTKRPWPTFSKIDSRRDDGNGNFNGLQVSMKRRMSGGFSLGSEYMWSHAINDNNVGGGESTAPENVNNRRAERANSAYDIRHTLTTNFVWELPFGTGKRFLNAGGFAGAVFGGWEMSGIWATRTGRMLTVTMSRSSSQMVDGNSSSQRPDIVPGVPIIPANQSLTNWLNRDAFKAPAKYTWGNAPRVVGTGPGVNQWDMSFQKAMKIAEGQKISFRAEFFNIFNRPHLANPGTAFTTPASFGRITSPQNREIGTGTARQIQFTLRYAF